MIKWFSILTLLQFSIAGYEWVLGAGIMFGLAFFLSMITYKTMTSFFLFLTIFDAFMVWAGLLDLWTLVACIMIVVIILFMQMKSQGSSDQ